MINILLVDDHEIVRRGVRQIIADEYPSGFVRDAISVDDAIERLDEAEWDLIICDLSMPGRGGFDLLQHVKSNKPDVPVLILSIHQEEKYAKRVLQSGAAGYLSKETVSSELVGAVKKIIQGKKYISEGMAERLAAELDLNAPVARDSHELLSEREFKVFLMLVQGQSITAISNQLFLSPNTVSTYRARIMAKMDLRSNADMVRYAIDHDLV